MVSRAPENRLSDKAVTAGEFMQKVLRKELTYWWFWVSPTTFQDAKVEDFLGRIVPDLASNLLDAASVWIPEVDLRGDSLVPDLDVHPAAEGVLGIPLVLKKLILESIEVILKDVDLSGVYDDDHTGEIQALPAEAAFAIGAAVAMLIEHMVELKADVKTAFSDIEPPTAPPLQTDFQISEAVNVSAELLQQYEKSRKRLFSLEREVQVRTRSEKEKLMCEKLERQLAEKRIMQNSESCLQRTMERTNDLSRLKKKLAETQRARRFSPECIKSTCGAWAQFGSTSFAKL